MKRSDKLEMSLKAQKACYEKPTKPTDPKPWKDWGSYLIYLSGFELNRKQGLAMRREAKEALETSLKNKDDDLEVWWKLGKVIMFIANNDYSICLSENLYKDHCNEAIKCFKTALALALESECCKDTTMFEMVQISIEFLNSPSDESS